MFYTTISLDKNKIQAPHIAEEEQQFMELRPNEDNSVARSSIMNFMKIMKIMTIMVKNHEELNHFR